MNEVWKMYLVRVTKIGQKLSLIFKKIYIGIIKYELIN